MSKVKLATKPVLRLVVTILALSLLIACSQGAAEPAPGPRVLSLQAFSGAGAWALSQEGLLRTNDAGLTWTDVTPIGLRGRDSRMQSPPFAFYLDEGRGWVAAFEVSTTGPLMAIFATSDGGTTWASQTLQLDADSGSYGGAGSLFFVDGQTGWLMSKLQTSSAASQGVLYGTHDGGQTWTKASIPIGGGFRFMGDFDGWVAGGAAGGSLYVTHDGGLSWEEQQVPLRSVEKPWLTTVAVPTFFDRSNGVLPVQVRSETDEGSRLHFFVTNDGGRSWTSTGSPLQTQRGGDIFYGEAATTAFVDRSKWFLVADQVFVTHNGGRDWSVIPTTRGLEDIVAIDFVSGEAGWAYLEKTACPDKVNCFTGSLVLTTQDGGRSWAVTAPAP